MTNDLKKVQFLIFWKKKRPDPTRFDARSACHFEFSANFGGELTAIIIRIYWFVILRHFRAFGIPRIPRSTVPMLTNFTQLT